MLVRCPSNVGRAVQTDPTLLHGSKRSVRSCWLKSLTNPGGGRGGYSMYPWLGRCGAAPHTLTLFKTNIADFPTHFKTEFRFLIPCLRHLTQFKTKIDKSIP